MLILKSKQSLPALIWILNVQYFIVQFLVATGWHNHFSLASNTISDLGNTVCGQYSGRFVCSPGHSWMNLSFILVGATQALGASLLYKKYATNLCAKAGFIFMVLAGAGTIIVGLFPENTVSIMHVIGAGLPFFLGNIAVLLLAKVLVDKRSIYIYSLISGVSGIVALGLFLTGTYIGLGPGGMERFVAYPQTIWMIVVGLTLLLKPHAKA